MYLLRYWIQTRFLEFFMLLPIGMKLCNLKKLPRRLPLVRLMYYVYLHRFELERSYPSAPNHLRSGWLAATLG